VGSNTAVATNGPPPTNIVTLTQDLAYAFTVSASSTHPAVMYQASGTCNGATNGDYESSNSADFSGASSTQMNTGVTTSGVTFTFTPSTVGTFFLMCKVHCFGVKINVVAGETPSSTGGGGSTDSSSTAGAPQPPALGTCYKSTCAPTLTTPTQMSSVLAIPAAVITATATANVYSFDFTENLSFYPNITCGDLLLHQAGTFTVGASTNVVSGGFQLTRSTTTFQATPMTTTAVAFLMSACTCSSTITWTLGGIQTISGSCITAGGCGLQGANTQTSVSTFPDATHWNFGQPEQTDGSFPAPSGHVALVACSGASVISSQLVLLALLVAFLLAIIA